MRNALAGTLVTALPLLIAVGIVAAPKPRATAPVQIPITGQSQGPDGTRYTLSGSVTLTSDSPTPIPTPIPTPDPLSLSYLTMAPAIVAPGGSAMVTVVLTRKAGDAVTVALKSADPLAQVAASMTIAAGQDHGTAAVTTAASITTERLMGIVATFNGQSRSANLTVRPSVTPSPVPVPNPTPVPPLPPEPVRFGPLPGNSRRVDADTVIEGEGFGTLPGRAWWNGVPVLARNWTEMGFTTVLPAPDAATVPGVLEVMRADGAIYAGVWPLEAAEIPAPVAPESRRR